MIHTMIENSAPRPQLYQQVRFQAGSGLSHCTVSQIGIRHPCQLRTCSKFAKSPPSFSQTVDSSRTFASVSDMMLYPCPPFSMRHPFLHFGCRQSVGHVHKGAASWFIIFVDVGFKLFHRLLAVELNMACGSMLHSHGFPISPPPSVSSMLSMVYVVSSNQDSYGLKPSRIISFISCRFEWSAETV